MYLPRLQFVDSMNKKIDKVFEHDDSDSGREKESQVMIFKKLT